MDPASPTTGEFILRDRSGKANVLVFIIIVTAVLMIPMSLHFVNTSDGIKIYLKDGFFFKDTYIDMTSLTFADLGGHPQVVSAMAKAGDLKYVPGGQALMLAEKSGYHAGEVVTLFNNDHQLKQFIDKWGSRGREKLKELKSRLDISGKLKKSKKFVEEKSKQVKDLINNQ